MTGTRMRGLLRVLVGLMALGWLLAFALPSGAAPSAAPAAGNDACGYPSASFTESTVMRWAQINGQGTSAQFVAYANDEKGLLLGVNGASPMSSATQNGSNGQTGGASYHLAHASGGSTTATDPSSRPFYPALYVTDVTAHPLAANGTGAGDFQNGGTPRNLSAGAPFVDDVFGTWSTATVSGNNYTVTPPLDKNNWNLGTGSDAPVGTTFAAMGNEGYGAEVRWNVNELTDSDGHALKAGNTYRIQVIEHDGDQNKSGGDAGEFCANLSIPAPPRPTLVTDASSGVVGGSISDKATLSGGKNPTGTLTWKLFGPGDTACSTPIQTFSHSVSGDGTYTSPSYTPTSPGIYRWIASYSGDGNNLSTAGSCNDPGEQSPVLSLVTSAPPSASVGDTITDTATLSGGAGPTGTITWRLYSDPGCTSLVDTVVANVHGNGSYSTSPGYTTTAAGTYHWVATYSGDANNASVSTACSDPNEQTIVTNQLTLVTDASSGSVGGSISDKATLSGGRNPTGSIIWRLYGPGDAACSSPIQTFSQNISGDGTYTSPTYSPASPGVYRWIASYSGDASNPPVSGACNDSGEESPVSSPGMSVLKFASVRCADLATPLTRWQPAGAQTCTGKWSNYLPESAGEMIVKLPRSAAFSIPIDYKIQVTNTGSEPLTLKKLDDPHCDSGSIAGPFQGRTPLSGALAAGEQAYFTCTHTLTASDDPSRHAPFTNVATVTGQPPSGPPLTGTSLVTVKTQHPGARRFCKDPRTGRRILWPKGTPKPKACKRFHPRPPKHPRGFTG
jgi:hypothetical protein